MPTPEELAADAETISPDASPGLNVLVSKLVVLKSMVDASETHLKDVRGEYDELRKRILPQALGDMGLKSVRTPLGTLSLRHRTWATVPAAQRDEARSWLTANGYAHMLTLEPAAALELANAFIADGDPIPSFIRVFVEEQVVLTKPKGAVPA